MKKYILDREVANVKIIWIHHKEIIGDLSKQNIPFQPWNICHILHSYFRASGPLEHFEKREVISQEEWNRKNNEF